MMVVDCMNVVYYRMLVGVIRDERIKTFTFDMRVFSKIKLMWSSFNEKLFCEASLIQVMQR